MAVEVEVEKNGKSPRKSHQGLENVTQALPALDSSFIHARTSTLCRKASAG